MNKKLLLPVILLLTFITSISFQPEIVHTAWAKSPEKNLAPTATITVCASGCDFVSIQDAIDDAETGDTIELFSETYEETITMDKDISLTGTGNQNTILQAASNITLASNRVITVTSGTTALIDSVTIRYGATAGYGGGIYNQGSLTILNSIITDNEANYGGGIANQTDSQNGSLFIEDTTITNNSALTGGAGIFNLATQSGKTSLINLNKVTIDNNDAGEGGGGGIYNRATAGNALINIENATIDGNFAEGVGGGILNSQSSGNASIEIMLSTINNNAASPGSNIYASSGEIILAQSILANGVGSGDCAVGSGIITDHQFNLVEDGTCGFAVGGDPQLNFLAENGGPTKTNALQSDSPALDRIPSTQCARSTDQRGESRPYGAGCDIGAFELHTQDLIFSIAANNHTVAPDELITFTISVEPIGPGISDGMVIGEKSEELQLQGDIVLTPPDFGSVGPYPPTIVQSLTISSNLTSTITMNTQVATGLPAGTQLYNQVAITSTEFITPLVSTATLTVKNVPPVAVDDYGPNFTTDPTTPFITGNVLANDYDLNGDTIIYISSTTDDLLGNLTDYTNGTFRYDPGVAFEDLPPGEVAYDTFIYNITDGLGGIVAGTVTITIHNDNVAVYLPLVVR